MDRTNNIAEGWHHAFSVITVITTGCKRPSFFTFLDNLKLDENIARGKIVSFEAGREAPKKEKEYELRDAAIKNVIQIYLAAAAAETAKEAAAKANEDDLDSDEEEEQQPQQQEDVMEQRKKWFNSAAYGLLKGIAFNTKL